MAGVRLGIIADDLTGACDVAARLTHLGYCPLVYLRARGGPPIEDMRAAVVVVNARSRDAPGDKAVTLVRAAVGLLASAGRHIFYYKMDSTLRGHWAKELRALHSLLGPKRVLICPAFPARGRFFRGGRLRLGKSERRDAYWSRRASSGFDLRVALKRHAGCDAQFVALETVRRGQKAVREVLGSAAMPYTVLDAAREQDLEIIGRAFRNSEQRILWAGSAGLVRYVCPGLTRSETRPDVVTHAPWLLIQGSRQRVSHEQFRHLAVEDSVRSIAFHSPADRRELQGWSGAVLAALGEGKHAAVTVSRDFDADRPEEFGRFLGRVLRAIPRRCKLGGIFVSGGNTTEAVCEGLRASVLKVTAEVRAGFAGSVLLDGRWPGLSLISKAGGFGGPEDVRQILKEISR